MIDQRVNEACEAQISQQSLRDRILAEFAPDVGSALIEFAAAIAAIDADFIVFMARKALRIHDLLVLAGCADNDRIMLSSHVLRQDLEIFRGKRVALIDDTLIVGTTIGGSRRKLEKVDAIVTCHVFALDKANWLPDVATPDRTIIQLEHDAMLTLCANEVEALAVTGIPYLADFPMTRPIKVTPNRLGLLQALQSWTPYPLTSERQADFGTVVFSILPSVETRDRLEDILGPLAAVTDIAKVRAYGQTLDGELRFRFVPVLTFKPMTTDHVGRLWEDVIARCALDAKQLAALERHLVVPLARLQFIQYCAGVWFGRAFIQDVERSLGLRRPIAFDELEAVRLFGPWLRGVITHIHGHDPMAAPSRRAPTTEVPEDVQTVSRRELLAVVRREDDETPPGRARNIFTDLTRAFSRLHLDHELPARSEARTLGRGIFEADASVAPHRDRLEYGFAWDTLVTCMLENEGVRVTPERSMRLSLLLDVLIDMGIAVPVLCERNGVLFRGYRHGEDVSFTDQEVALAHDVMSGYCQGAQRETVPKLVTEKLLVSLFRVGVAKGFLRVIHGPGGGERVARIGFHLHGALPFIPMDETIYAEDHDSWITTYLTDLGVITPAPRGGYALGVRPEAAMHRSSSSTDARQLGWLIGRLLRERTAEGKPVMDSEDLVLLTSCPQPKDAAGAVVAELRIFLRWFPSFERTLAQPPSTVRRPRSRESIDWTSLDSIRVAQRRFVGGNGYMALHSARMKLTGYHSNAALTVFERCEAHLQSLDEGGFMALGWRGNWAQIVEPGKLDQVERFGSLLGEMDLELFKLAIGVFSIELGLLSAEAALEPSGEMTERYAKTCDKALGFLREVRGRVDPDPTALAAYDRLCDVAANSALMPAPARACTFGVHFIGERRHMVSMLVRRARDAIVRYGMKEPRTTYDYSLWYDIVDSTGQKAALRGDTLRAYRMRVRDFKRRVSEDLENLISAAAASNGHVYCWNAPLESADDEKNVFFSGRNALTWLRDASDVLLRVARDHGIRLRMLMINGDFAGDAPYKFLSRPQVDGESYWETVSRVKEGVKRLEAQMEPRPTGPIVWAAQDVVTDVLEKFPHLRWKTPPCDETVSVDIENYPLAVRVCGGEVA